MGAFLHVYKFLYPSNIMKIGKEVLYKYKIIKKMYAVSKLLFDRHFIDNGNQFGYNK